MSITFRRRRSAWVQPSWREPATWPPLARLLTGALALICGVLGFLTALAAVTLPDVNTLGALTGSVRVLDRNGREVAEIGHGGTAHLSVSLDRVSPIMQQATLAADYREPVCGMNLALLEGVQEGAGAAGVKAQLEPEDGYCCVSFRPLG